MARIRSLRLIDVFPVISLCIIVVGLFIFLATLSPYPAGDDPGYHSSILRYVMLNHDVRFPIPFFPQLNQLWGSERFITTMFLGAFGTLSAFNDVFRLIIVFAAFSAAFALVPVYLLIVQWLHSKIVAVLAVAYLTFSKFYVENFFEGSYDQYTGLLLVTWILYAQYRWITTRNTRWLGMSVGFTALLLKTHELGFFVAILLIITNGLNEIRFRFGTRKFIMVTLFSIVILSVFFAARPAYFPVNATGYSIRSMLEVSEGTPLLALAVIGIGAALFIVRNPHFVLFSYIVISLILSQSALIDSPFYPFRFNVYFLVAVALLFAISIDGILRVFKRASILPPLFVFMIIAFIVIPQIVSTHALGSWITDQRLNPASVVLEDDLKAFRWMKENLPVDAVVLAPFKWGYYLPAIAERSVVLDNAIGGDERDVRFQIAHKGRELYREKSTQRAAQLADELSVGYILWDESISRFPERYPGYDDEKFKQSEYFRVRFVSKNTVVYEVL